MKKYERDLMEINGVHEKKLEDIAKMYSLRERVSRRNIKLINKRDMTNDWEYLIHISLSKKIDSEEEFKKYLERNNINGYKFGKTRCGLEDYFIIFESGLQAEFYSPYE